MTLTFSSATLPDVSSGGAASGGGYTLSVSSGLARSPFDDDPESTLLVDPNTTGVLNYDPPVASPPVIGDPERRGRHMSTSPDWIRKHPLPVRRLSTCV